MVSRPDFNKVIMVPHNYRELSQFLAKERWLELMQDKDIEALQALIALLTETEQWPLLTRHIFAYMYTNQGKIADKALHSVRRLLGTHPSWVVLFLWFIQNQFWRFSCSAESVKLFYRIILYLITFLIDAMCPW
jgi:hypothetical protein